MVSPEVDLLAHRRTTTSHTIGTAYLRELLGVVPIEAERDEYAFAVVERNVLGRSSHVGRLRVLRHLRELYALDPTDTLFRVLRVLDRADRESLPVLAGMLAVARDELFRASWPVVAGLSCGERVGPERFADAVAAEFGSTVAPATYARVGRNVAASWAQTGHLTGSRVKVRGRVVARPAGIAVDRAAMPCRCRAVCDRVRCRVASRCRRPVERHHRSESGRRW